MYLYTYIYLYLNILFIYFERGREGEREGEKHQCVVAPRTPPTGDQARKQPRQVLRRGIEPCGSQAHTQSTELHQPGQIDVF